MSIVYHGAKKKQNHILQIIYITDLEIKNLDLVIMSLRNCPLFFVMDTGFRIHLDGDFGEAQGFALREVMAYAIVKHRAHARREVKCATHARRHFTCRRHTSRTEGVLIVPLGTLSCKKSLVFRQGSFYWWGKMDSNHRSH